MNLCSKRLMQKGVDIGFSEETAKAYAVDGLTLDRQIKKLRNKKYLFARKLKLEQRRTKQEALKEAKRDALSINRIRLYMEKREREKFYNQFWAKKEENDKKGDEK